MADLNALPVLTQIVLASGYVAYRIGYQGVGTHQRPIEIVFGSLAFSLIASGVLALLSLCTSDPVVNDRVPLVVNGCVAVVVTLAAGVLWRKWGGEWFFVLMRKWDISWANDRPSALGAIIHNNKFRVSQVAVELDDGTWLRCDNTSDFSAAPFGPCLLGPDGSVGLYLTHVDDPKGESKKLRTTVDPHYGHRITYVPANKIRRVALRHVRHAS